MFHNTLSNWSICTFLCFLCVFGIHAQDTAIYNPEFSIDEALNPLGKYYSDKEQEDVNKWIGRFSVYYQLGDVENLIDDFGKDFYLKPDSTFRHNIDEYLAQFVKQDLSCSDLKHLIDETYSKYNNMPPEPYFTHNAWDGILTHNIYSKGRWSYEDSLYHPISWQYETKWDSISFQPKVVNRELVIGEIKGIANFFERYEVYLLFIRNLYADGCWNDFFYASNDFVNTLNDEQFILTYTEDSTNTIFGTNTPFQPELIQYQKDENHPFSGVSNPFETKINRLQSQKATWIVSLLKLMASSGHVFGEYSQHAAMCFGTLDALLEETDYGKRNVVRSLEIQFLNTISTLDFTDDQYYLRAWQLVDEYGNTHNKNPQFLCLGKNAEYSLYSLQILLIDWSFFLINNGHYYDERKLHTSLLIYNSLRYIKDGKDEYQGCKQDVIFLKKQLLYSLIDYFSITNQSSALTDCFLSIIKHIHDNPQYYSLDEFEFILLRIAYLFESININCDSEIFPSHIISNEDVIEGQGYGEIIKLGWHGNLTEEQKRKRFEIIWTFLEVDSVEIHEIPTFYSGIPPVIAQMMYSSMNGMDQMLIENSRYSDAYKILRIKHELSKVHGASSYSEYKQIRDEFYLVTLRSEIDFKQQSFEGRVRNLMGESHYLIGLVNERTIRLDKLDQTLKRKEGLLQEYNDSVLILQDSAAIISDRLEFWKDTSAVIADKNRELDSLARAANIAALKEKKSRENFELAALVIFVLLVGAVLLLFRNIRLRKNAVRSRTLSDALRLSIAQVSHIAKNSLSRFNSHFYKDEENNALPDREEESSFIEQLTLFFQRFEKNHKTKQTHQSIENEVAFGLQLAKIDYRIELLNSQLENLIQYNNPSVKHIKVPIYSVVNLVYNAYKHSDQNQPVPIHISGKEYNDFWEVEFLDFGVKEEKGDYRGKHGHGVTFIEDMLRIYNRKKRLQKLIRNGNANQYSVKFKITKV